MICNDFGRIASANADPGGDWGDFESEVGITLRIRGIDTHFESEVGITLQIWGGLTLILGGVNQHSTWKVKLGLPCRSRVDRH